MEMTYNRVLLKELGYASDEPFEFKITKFRVSLMDEVQQEKIKKRMDKELRKGLVIAVGPECVEVQVGDTVIYDPKYLTKVDLKDMELRAMCREEFLMAKI